MFGFEELPPITFEGLLATLYAIVAVMLIIVLYHVLFIVVDLRKIMRRFDDLTEQVEMVLLKPLAIIDEAFQWVVEHLGTKKSGKKHGKSKGKGIMDVTEV